MPVVPRGSSGRVHCTGGQGLLRTCRCGSWWSQDCFRIVFGCHCSTSWLIVKGGTVLWRLAGDLRRGPAAFDLWKRTTPRSESFGVSVAAVAFPEWGRCGGEESSSCPRRGGLDPDPGCSAHDSGKFVETSGFVTATRSRISLGSRNGPRRTTSKVCLVLPSGSPSARLLRVLTGSGRHASIGIRKRHVPPIRTVGARPSCFCSHGAVP